MNGRDKILFRIIDSGVVAVIRMESTDKLINVIEAIRKGGINCLEITMTVPNAVDMIKEVSKKVNGDFLLGAGTVLDPETARLVILAGAEFIVSPTLNLDVIRMAHRYNKVVIPGAFTPTEILTAWEYGADLVKVFPATLGGPKYFKDISGPLPHIRMIPTGGVNLENAADFIKAGACCVAIGTSLLDKKAIAEENFSVLTDNASKLIRSVQKARNI